MFNTSTICILISVVVYLLGMLAIGIMYSKNSTTEDFYLGGRKLGPIVTAMSTEASDMSAYLLMGVPGLAFFCGVAEAGWTAIGLALGTYLNWLIVAKRMRQYSAKTHSITVPDFLAVRFRDNTKVIETIGAIVVIVFFVPYTASGFAACGKLFNSLFGFDYMTAMIISAAVIVAYCATGGFMAASVTSLIQSIVMTAALVIILIFGINTAGGWDAVVANAKDIPGYLSFTASTDIYASSAGSYSALKIASTLAWGLGYFGMPHILLRFMAIREEKELNLSRRIATVWVVISMAIAIAIGVIGLAVTKAGSIPFLGSSAEAETIIIQLANLMSQHGFLLIIAAGIIISGILAATMSTADSQLLAAASSVSQDLMQDFLGIKLSAKTTMLVARVTVLVIAVISIFLAWDPNSSVFRVVSFAWAGFGAAFGPVILLSLFWKRLTFGGTVAGIAAGAAVDILWLVFLSSTDIYEIVPGFAAGLLAAVVVSLLSKGPGKDVEDLFDRAVDLKS